MVKNLKFNKSQIAHKRLFEKYDAYRSKKSRRRCKVLANYHFKVFSDQSIMGRVLSKSERKKIYNSVCK